MDIVKNPVFFTIAVGKEKLTKMEKHRQRTRKKRGTGTSPNRVVGMRWTLFYYHITVPPVLMSCPVIVAESSEARKTANEAASSEPEPLSL